MPGSVNIDVCGKGVNENFGCFFFVFFVVVFCLFVFFWGGGFVGGVTK